MINQKPERFLEDVYRAISARAEELLKNRDRVLVAVDGNCCAGKTTSAARLGEMLGASVFHMDDFFLQPQMRTPERMRQPGGNVDAERFLADVLIPVSQGGEARVRRYDCHEDALLPEVLVSPGRFVIVEGTYSLHPLLAPYYNLKIFCRVSSPEQTERIRARNGEDALRTFVERWIPLENAYFNALRVEEGCDFVIDSSQRHT
jgi:uridine kinase